MKLSPFADAELGAELRARHTFWHQKDFYGLDLSAALPLAVDQQLRELVLDLVDPDTLLVPPELAPAETIDMATPDDPSVWNNIKWEVSFPHRDRDAVIDGICGWW